MKVVCTPIAVDIAKNRGVFERFIWRYVMWAKWWSCSEELLHGIWQIMKLYTSHHLALPCCHNESIHLSVGMQSPNVRQSITSPTTKRCLTWRLCSANWIIRVAYSRQCLCSPPAWTSPTRRGCRKYCKGQRSWHEAIRRARYFVVWYSNARCPSRESKPIHI